jgi:hypothetical protein
MRDSTGQRIDVFLWDAGEGLLRLTRANAAFGSNFSGGENSNFPWDCRVDYNLDLRKNWLSETQRDTLIMSQSARIRGSVRIADRWRFDVNGGYDLVNRELTPTQLDVYLDLHCWELSVNWVPIGIRKSIYLRLNIKASMLKDLKLEFRDSDLPFLY